MLVENGHDHNHLLTKVTEKGYRKNKYNDESKTDNFIKLSQLRVIGPKVRIQITNKFKNSVDISC